MARTNDRAAMQRRMESGSLSEKGLAFAGKGAISTRVCWRRGHMTEADASAGMCGLDLNGTLAGQRACPSFDNEFALFNFL